MLNLFACLKQLAAAHPPHTHSRTHTHTHGLAVNALINVFWRGGLKAKTAKCQAPPKAKAKAKTKAKRHLHKCRADAGADFGSDVDVDVDFDIDVLHVIERWIRCKLLNKTTVIYVCYFVLFVFPFCAHLFCFCALFNAFFPLVWPFNRLFLFAFFFGINQPRFLLCLFSRNNNCLQLISILNTVVVVVQCVCISVSVYDFYVVNLFILQ